jgi:hypothetical protein
MIASVAVDHLEQGRLPDAWSLDVDPSMSIGT